MQIWLKVYLYLDLFLYLAAFIYEFRYGCIYDPQEDHWNQEIFKSLCTKKKFFGAHFVDFMLATWGSTLYLGKHFSEDYKVNKESENAMALLLNLIIARGFISWMILLVLFFVIIFSVFIYFANTIDQFKT